MKTKRSNKSFKMNFIKPNEIDWDQELSNQFEIYEAMQAKVILKEWSKVQNSVKSISQMWNLLTK